VATTLCPTPRTSDSEPSGAGIIGQASTSPRSRERANANPPPGRRGTDGCWPRSPSSLIVRHRRGCAIGDLRIRNAALRQLRKSVPLDWPSRAARSRPTRRRGDRRRPTSRSPVRPSGGPGQLQPETSDRPPRAEPSSRPRRRIWAIGALQAVVVNERPAPARLYEEEGSGRRARASGSRREGSGRERCRQ
jgi:hypothetical protein